MKLPGAIILVLSNILFSAFGQVDWPQFSFTQVAAGLSFPTHIANAGDGSGRLFIVEQLGKILILESNAILPTPFLDISGQTTFELGTDDGLLTMAFPPDYSSKRCFYVYYTRQPDNASVVSRFFVSTNRNVADVGSEQVILTMTQDSATLNAGLLTFGPDGFLYISTGDSGYDRSVGSLSQNPGSFWGKLLRIDVNGPTNTYLVPTNNPFVGRAGFRPEIWDLGLRNPWRFAFDRVTGDLYVTDVGADFIEEVNFEAAPITGGRNYGWRLKEGSSDYTEAVLPSLTQAMLTDPVVEFTHDAGLSSITGGPVYRGTSSARMNGMYLHGDLAGAIGGVKRDGATWRSQPLAITPFLITTFGEDEAGELYVADYGFFPGAGKIYSIVDTGQARPPEFDPADGISFSGSVTLNTTTPGATIRYTTNGVDPGPADPGVSPGATVTVVSGTILKARSYRPDLIPSDVSALSCTLQAATPAFRPAQGPITNATLVTLLCATPAATIRYTLDGSDPTPASAIYLAPIAIDSSTPLRARAYRTGFADSAVGAFYSPEFILQKLSFDALGNTVVSWSSLVGRSYQVQFSFDMKTWRAAGGIRPGTGGILNQTNAILDLPVPSRRYFRVNAL